MKSRIVICRSNSVAPDPRVEKIGRALAQTGYDIQIVGWDRTTTLPRREVLPWYRIQRLQIRAAYGAGLQNLPQLLRWQVSLLYWLFTHRKKFDLIHACDFDTVLPALMCKWFWGKRVVYDIFDFYADHLRRTPTVIKQIIRWIDLWVINRVDALILVDDARKEQISGASPRRCAFIYNSPEDAQGILQARDDDWREIGFTSASTPGYTLRLAYIGQLQMERGLSELLEVLKNHPEWILDLAGFGGDEERIVGLVSQMPNVVWYGRIPYQKALQISAAADLLFATYDPSVPNHRFSSPNKIFEAMMLGKPIIVARDTNMDRIVASAGCGVIINYGRHGELEEALERLEQSPELRRHLGENARRAYENRYGWNVMAGRLADLYREISTE